jgi:hypothetical protein
MKFTLLAALLFSSATALAGPHDELVTARQHVQEASTRVSYFEMQATIAERDIATAQIRRDTASKQRNQARIAQAEAEQREAQDRAAQARNELTRARGDLQASADQARRLEGFSRASR